MPKRKNRVGRPRVKDPKQIPITIRLASKEKAQLTKAAKKAGMSLSAYIMAPHRKDKGE